MNDEPVQPPFDTENYRRDPREDMTAEELRAREDNLQRVGEFLYEVIDDMQRQSEAPELDKVRARARQLHNDKAHGLHVDPHELAAVDSQLIELEDAERKLQPPQE